jgi:hypothetical protein
MGRISWINTSKKGVFSWVLEHYPDKPAISHQNTTKQAHFKPENCRILPLKPLFWRISKNMFFIRHILHQESSHHPKKGQSGPISGSVRIRYSDVKCKDQYTFDNRHTGLVSGSPIQKQAFFPRISCYECSFMRSAPQTAPNRLILNPGIVVFCQKKRYIGVFQNTCFSFGTFCTRI